MPEIIEINKAPNKKEAFFDFNLKSIFGIRNLKLKSFCPNPHKTNQNIKLVGTTGHPKMFVIPKTTIEEAKCSGNFLMHR